MKKFTALRQFLCCAAISMAATFFTAPFADVAMAQSADNWAADDNAIESRKIERYQQLVDQSPEKSYGRHKLRERIGFFWRLIDELLISFDFS